MKAPQSDITRRILASERASGELMHSVRSKDGRGSVKVGDTTYSLKAAPKYTPKAAAKR